MKRNICRLLSFLLIVMFLMPVHTKAEGTPTGLDQSFLCNQLITEQLSSESNYQNGWIEVAEDVMEFLNSESFSSDSKDYYLGSPIILYETDGYYIQPSRYMIYPIFDDIGKVVLTYICNGNDSKISDVFCEELNLVLCKHERFIAVINDYNEFTFVDGQDIELSDEEFDEYAYDFGREQIPTERMITNGKSGNRTTLSLPPKGQGIHNNACWAACMASMIQHYTGVTTSTYSVMTTTSGGNNTKTASQVAQYLLTYYDIYAYVLSFSNSTLGSTVRSYLDNNKAFILGWTPKINVGGVYYSFGHMTICDGHTYSNSKYKYHIMDPRGSVTNNPSNFNNYTTYWLQTTSSSAMPENQNILITGVGSYTWVESPVTAVLVYNRYEPNRHNRIPQ